LNRAHFHIHAFDGTSDPDDGLAGFPIRDRQVEKQKGTRNVMILERAIARSKSSLAVDATGQKMSLTLDRLPRLSFVSIGPWTFVTA
jgi:hypothetical protein